MRRPPAGPKSHQKDKIEEPSKPSQQEKGWIATALEDIREIKEAALRRATELLTNLTGNQPPSPRKLSMPKAPYRTTEHGSILSLDQVSPLILGEFGLRYYYLPPLPEAAALLAVFSKNVEKNPEEREKLWQKLQVEWHNKFPDVVLPSILKDFPYPLNFESSFECLVENYDENALERNDDPTAQIDSLLSRLCIIASDSLTYKVPYEAKRFLPRFEIDQIIDLAGKKTLLEMGLNPEKFEITHIPHEVYLRMAIDQNWGKKHPTLVANTFNHQDVIAGGNAPDSTKLICVYPANVRHATWPPCENAHHIGLIRLVIVPKS